MALRQSQMSEIVAGPGARRDAHIPLGMLQVGPYVNHRLTYDEEERVRAAKKYAMESSIKHVLLKQQVALQQSKQENVIRHQTLLLMCRVYVGSISFELNEEAVRVAFAPFGAIRTINMSYDPVLQKHKGFAFIEYEVPEGASVALEQMLTATLGGRSIKVGRPSNMPQSAPIIEELTVASLNSPRIYIASIHPDVTEDDLRSVFSAFGTILKTELLMYPNTPRHKGYAYVTFDSSQAAHDAIQAMNLFDLAGMYLRITRAILPEGVNSVAQLAAPATPLPAKSAVAAAAVTAKLQNAFGQIVEDTLAPSYQAASGSAVVSPAANIGALSVDRISVRSQEQQQSTASPSLLRMPTMNEAFNDAVETKKGFSPFAKAEADRAENSPSAYVPPPMLVLPKLATRPTPATTYVAPEVVDDMLMADADISEAATTTSDMVQPPEKEIPRATSLEVEKELEAKLVAAEVAQISAQQQPRPSTADDDDVERDEVSQIRSREARQIMTQKLSGKNRFNEARVVCLRGMVTADEIDETLEEEVKEECKNYGPVQKVVIYSTEDAQVKIFVEFATAAGAQSAQAALNGRFFGGRQVACNFYDQALFDFNDLSA